MNRARLTQFFCFIAAVCIGSITAHAQGIRIFAMGSGSFFLNQKYFTAVGEPFRSDYASGGKITLGGELSSGDIFGMEAAYGYGTNNLRVTDLTASQTQGYGVKMQRLSANLLLHSPVGVFGVKPYLTGGVEYDRFGPTTQAKDNAITIGFAGQDNIKLGASNKIGVNYGGGVEWSFFPMLALRVDFRDHLTGTPTYGLPSGQYSVSGVGHDPELSAGLVLHLGK